MKTYQRLWWVACAPLLFSLSSLGAEQIAVVKDGRVNVRGQPSLVGEVITQLQKGEKVVVLEEIPVSKPKTNEPARWARIQMPANTPVWLNGSFIDPATHAVKVNRLNLRAGPGENYSVVGRLPKGTTVTEIRRVEDWVEIETPPGAYGFVAADLLTTPAAGAAMAAVTPEQPAKPAPQPSTPPPANTTATVPPPADTPPANSRPTEPAPATVAPQPNAVTTETEKPKTAPEAPPPVTSIPPTTVPTPTIKSPAVAAAPLAKKPEEAPSRRVVRREGIVRSTTSIQSPTYYELLSPENRKTINYLHMEALAMDLKDYRGRRIVVTGEELIDPRWPKTPVIEVDHLELIP